MRVWGVSIAINCVALLVYQFSIDNFGDSIKYFTPILMFFYLRRFIQNKEDLHFILQTFVYSCIFPFGMLAFEVFVHPIDPHHVSEGRGGGTRLRGSYGDSMSYAVYFVGLLLIYSYFYLDKMFTPVKKERPPSWKMVAVFFMCLGGIISIRHVSTWSVFLAIIVMLMYFNAKNMRGAAIFIFLGLIIGPFFAQSIYQSQIYPLIAKEFNVINGDTDIQYGMDGRISRWQRYFEIWDKMPSFSHIFGVSFSQFKEASIMIGGGMHNDFIRLLFLTGWFGLAIYVIFLFLVVMRKKYFRPQERYLIMSAFAATFLYSISTLPSLYLAFMNYTFPIFCFALLPRKKAYAIVASPVPVNSPPPPQQQLPLPAPA